MGTLLAKILPLALGAAISPTFLGISVLTLAGSNHPQARAWALAAGGMAVITVFALAVVLFVHGALDSGGKHRSVAGAVLDLVAGILLVLLGVRAALREPKPRPQREPDAEDETQPARLGRFFGIGAGAMVANLSTLVLVFPAAREIGASGLGAPQEALALAIVLAIVSIPVVGPPLAYTVAPGAGARAMASLNVWLLDHRRGVAMALCFGFGAYLVIKGATAL